MMKSSHVIFVLIEVFNILYVNSVNIFGGYFRTNFLIETDLYVLFSFQQTGPKMCIWECLLHKECTAVNYWRNTFLCELLKSTSGINPVQKTGSNVFFTTINGWAMDNNACWPNPCSGKTKCQPAMHDQHVCITYDQACDSAPCKYGTSCRHIVGNDYRCACVPEMSGKNCEVLDPYSFMIYPILIRSNYFPNPYESNAHKSWSYLTAKNQKILLTITTFSTEGNYDFLRIYSRTDKTDLIVELSGELAVPYYVYSRDYAVYLEFTSDVGVQLQGFEIRIEPCCST